MKGQVFIITGGASGIGRALALSLCEQGVRVVIIGRDGDKLNRVQANFKAKGHELAYVQGDVTHEADCQKVVGFTLLRYGKVNGLVNNASQTLNANFECVQPEIFKQIVDVNLMGTVQMTKAALPYIKETKGSIIFMSSIAGLNGMPSAAAYACGKMALTALWQALRVELYGSNIHLGIAYIGFTKNDSSKQMLNGSGDLVPVPKRPAFIQQSQEKVARQILRLIKYRKRKTVLSSSGKLLALWIRYFPRGFNWLMMKLYNKKQRSNRFVKNAN